LLRTAPQREANVGTGTLAGLILSARGPDAERLEIARGVGGAAARKQRKNVAGSFPLAYPRVSRVIVCARQLRLFARDAPHGAHDGMFRSDPRVCEHLAGQAHACAQAPSDAPPYRPLRTDGLLCRPGAQGIAGSSARDHRQPKPNETGLLATDKGRDSHDFRQNDQRRARSHFRYNPA